MTPPQSQPQGAEPITTRRARSPASPSRKWASHQPTEVLSLRPNDWLRQYPGEIFGQGDWITRLLTAQAIRDAQARQQGRLLEADLVSGGDPLLRGYAATAGSLRASGDVAQSLSQAQLQQALAQQDFLRKLYLSVYGYEGGPQKGRYNQRNPWADYGAQAAGAAAGAAIGGV